MDLRVHHSLPATAAKLPRRLLEVPKGCLLYSDHPELREPRWRGEETRGLGKHSLLGRGSWESTESRRPAQPGGKVREGKEFQ